MYILAEYHKKSFEYYPLWTHIYPRMEQAEKAYRKFMKNKDNVLDASNKKIDIVILEVNFKDVGFDR